MNTSTLTPLYRGLVVAIVATSVACVAVILHYIIEEITQGTFNPSHFFSYFTIQVGSLFAIVNLAYVALKPWRTKRSVSHKAYNWLQRLELARFCVMVYAIIIVPVYWFVVSTPSQWTLDWWVVIHLVMPVVAVATWFSTPRCTMPTLRWTFWPLSYVAAFAAWSLVHGAIAADHWFPYDFFDFVTNGWAHTGLWIAGLFVGVLTLGFVMCLCTLNRAGRISH